MPIVWQFESKPGVWENYSSEADGLVEKALLSDGAPFTFVDDVTFGGFSYEVNFIDMTQKNKQTGKVRKIRRNTPQGIWFFKDDKNSRRSYPTKENDALDAKATQQQAGMGPIFTFKMFNTLYEINLTAGAMTQRNMESNTVREIVRIGGTNELQDFQDGNPAPSKKSHAEPSTAKSAAQTGTTTTHDGKSSTTTTATNIHQGSYGSASAVGGAYGGLMKVVKKGQGVVDPLSGYAVTHHVVEMGNPPVPLQCMLNQTNLGQNNNKFYVIQLLERDGDNGGSCLLFTRWGRIGAPGQTAMDTFSSTQAGMYGFDAKFKQKTGHPWSLRTLPKKDGKYQYMDIDFGAEVDTTPVAAPGSADSTVPLPDSKLPYQLQNLMKLISNKTFMMETMKELEIDVNKMPLGKISKKQIKEAFGYLKAIESELAKPYCDQQAILHQASMFYTLIPHNYGMKVPPNINNHDILKKKMTLLETLGEIEIATTLLNKEQGGNGPKKHPMDAAYEDMKCDLQPLSHSSEVFQRVATYVRETHAKTHNQYTLSVAEVFEVVRAGEADRYQAYKDLHNKQMLWHGSRLPNFLGIMSQGLRIAPKEAPSTGYMYGKGVYFADCASKSANYCHASSSQNTGLLLLCEVALGTTKDFKKAHYTDQPMPGSNSTRGLGRAHPDPNQAVIDQDGVKWPVGKMVDSAEGSGSVLLYPEYIVYDVAQCKMRYLVQLKFHFK